MTYLQMCFCAAHPPALDKLKCADTKLIAPDTMTQLVVSGQLCETDTTDRSSIARNLPTNTLAQQVATMRRKINKQREENLAALQQSRLKDQRIMMAEKKIEDLEKHLCRRVADIKALKSMANAATRANVTHDQIRNVMTRVQQARNRTSADESERDQGVATSWHEWCQWIEGLLQNLISSDTGPALSHDHRALHAVADSNTQVKLSADVRRLQRALSQQEKELQNMVPASKYMQEVSANKAMKKQLADSQCISHNIEGLKNELRKRDKQLGRWRSENASLKRKVASLEATVGSACPCCGNNTQGSSQDNSIAQHGASAQQTLALDKRITDVCAENEALRRELNAFDPEFFDEIEDLKFERHQLAEQVERYAARIQLLAAELDIQADFS
eukprot:jgi/Ulvmu1/5942/UM026_0064.1